MERRGSTTASLGETRLCRRSADVSAADRLGEARPTEDAGVLW